MNFNIANFNNRKKTVRRNETPMIKNTRPIPEVMHSTKRKKQNTPDKNIPLLIVQECWLLPSVFTTSEILGQARENLSKWENQSNTKLKYIDSERKLEINGSIHQIEKFKKIAQAKVDDLHLQIKRKTRVITKPLAVKTDALESPGNTEETRLEDLRNKPEKGQPHQASFTYPKEMNLETIYKKKLKAFDEIRRSLRCNIWLSETNNCIFISSNCYHKTQNAKNIIKEVYKIELKKYNKQTQRIVVVPKYGIKTVLLKKTNLQIERYKEAKKGTVLLVPTFCYDKNSAGFVSYELSQKTIANIREQILHKMAQLDNNFNGVIYLKALVGKIYIETNNPGELADKHLDIDVFKAKLFSANANTCKLGIYRNIKLNDLGFKPIQTHCLNGNHTGVEESAAESYVMYVETNDCGLPPTMILILQTHNTNGSVTSCEMYKDDIFRISKTDVIMSKNTYDFSVVLDAFKEGVNEFCTERCTERLGTTCPSFCTLSKFLKSINCVGNSIRFKNTPNTTVYKVAKIKSISCKLSEYKLEILHSRIWNIEPSNNLEATSLSEKDLSSECFSMSIIAETFKATKESNSIKNMTVYKNSGFFDGFVKSTVGLISNMDKLPSF